MTRRVTGRLVPILSVAVIVMSLMPTESGICGEELIHDAVFGSVPDSVPPHLLQVHDNARLAGTLLVSYFVVP